MKFIPKEPIAEVVREEMVDGILYQGIKYRCPDCLTEVFHYQERCECGQRLKPYSKLNNLFDEIWKRFQEKIQD